MSLKSVDKATTARIRKLVESTSVSAVSKNFDVANATVLRLVAGLPVNVGTLTLVEQRLKSIEGAEVG